MSIILEVLTIAVYMLSMIAIGAHVSKKNKSTDVYYLGGRQLGPMVTAMSAEASDMSSWLLMGLPGVALFGIIGGNGSFAEAFWTAAGLVAGTYLNWLIVAKPLRIYSEHIEANTIPDFFSNRFGEKKGCCCSSAQSLSSYSSFRTRLPVSLPWASCSTPCSA